jgi:hypothetical protein
VAQYCLTEEEARQVISQWRFHPAIDKALSQRFIKDPEYRERINEARRAIADRAPAGDVARIEEWLTQGVAGRGSPTDKLTKGAAKTL